MVGVGISFGCSSATLAVCRDGSRSEVVANSAGDRATSTIVAVMDGEILTGTPALQAQLRQPAQAVTQLKRLLAGIPAEEQPCRLEERKGEMVVNFSDTAKGVSQLVKGVFSNLKETADSALGSEGSFDTVLCVPPTCKPQYANTLRSCAASAGFNVVGTITEPIAALSTQITITSGLTLVVRVGGYSSSLSLVRCNSGLYTLVDHMEVRIGGRDMDLAVGGFLQQEFNRKHRCKVEENQRAVGKILRAAKQAKHALSTQNTTEYNIESLFEGIDHIGSLSRPRFETLIQPSVSKIQDTVREFAGKHDLTNLSAVVLSGGSTRIPKVQSVVRSSFPNTQTVFDSPDEISAMGAADHAFQLASYPDLLKNITMENDGSVSVSVVPDDVVAVVSGDERVVVVEKGAALPCKREVPLPEGKEVLLRCGEVILSRIEVQNCDGDVMLGLDIAEDGSMEGVIRDDNERTNFSIPSN